MTKKVNISEFGSKILDAGRIAPGGRVSQSWEAVETELIKFTKAATFNKKVQTNSEDFIKYFGLKGVEFGNWMSQEDRLEFIYGAAHSFEVMRKFLGVPAKSMGLGGRLAIAFGARGKGLDGAAAHYEPKHRVINITKMKPANGSLWHEYAHAVDNIVYQTIRKSEPGLIDLGFASGGFSGTKAIDLDRLQRNDVIGLMENIFASTYWNIDGSMKKWLSDFMSSGKGDSEYYNRRCEMFARFSEVWCNQVADKMNTTNTMLVKLKYEKVQYPPNNVISALFDEFKQFYTVSINFLNGDGTYKIAVNMATPKTDKPKAEPKKKKLKLKPVAKNEEGKKSDSMTEEEIAAMKARLKENSRKYSEKQEAARKKKLENYRKRESEDKSKLVAGVASHLVVPASLAKHETKIKNAYESLARAINGSARGFIMDSKPYERRMIEDHGKSLISYSEELHAIDPEAIDKFLKKYVELYSKIANTNSSQISSFVAGPSGMNVARQKKLQNWEDNHRKRFYDFLDNVVAKTQRKKNKKDGVNLPTNLLPKAQNHLEELEARRDRIKMINKTIKSKKVTEEFKKEHRKFVKDYFGDVEFKELFPSFMLSNLAATIRSTKKRVSQLELRTKDLGNVTDLKFNGGKLVRNIEADRIQVIFDDIPDADTRTKFKKNGWRWSPRYKAWQRQITRNAHTSLLRLSPMLGLNEDKIEKWWSWKTFVSDEKLKEYEKREKTRNATDGIKARLGNSTEIDTQNESLKVKYALVERDDLVQSNDPITFKPNPKYPKACQTRNYNEIKGEQEKVIKYSSNFKPSHLVNNSPDATTGSPIVTSKGIVLGGNGRTMILKRLSPEKWNDYFNYLAPKLKDFGIDEKELIRYSKPVLVRMLGNVSLSKCSYYSDTLNSNTMQDFDPVTKSISIAKSMDNTTFERIANIFEDTEGDTFAQVLSVSTASKKIIDLLTQKKFINTSNRDVWLDGNGLSSKGKETLENVLLAYILPDKKLIEKAKVYTNKIVKALPLLVKIKQFKGQWNLIPDIQKVIELENSRRSTGQTKTDYLNQDDIFKKGKNPTVSDKQKLVWSLMDSGVLKFKEALASYIRTHDNENSENAMFGGGNATPLEVLANLKTVKGLSDKYKRNTKTSKKGSPTPAKPRKKRTTTKYEVEKLSDKPKKTRKAKTTKKATKKKVRLTFLDRWLGVTK